MWYKNAIFRLEKLSFSPAAKQDSTATPNAEYKYQETSVVVWNQYIMRNKDKVGYVSPSTAAFGLAAYVSSLHSTILTMSTKWWIDVLCAKLLQGLLCAQVRRWSTADVLFCYTMHKCLASWSVVAVVASRSHSIRYANSLAYTRSSMKQGHNIRRWRPMLWIYFNF